MNTTIQVVGTGLVAAMVGVAVSVFVIAQLRSRNFAPVGRLPAAPIRGADEPTRSSEIKYHNEAIYRDFEYFFRVTAGLLGGSAFLVVQSKTPELTKNLDLLILLTAVFQALATCAATLFVLSHQKSKIERWAKRFTLKAILGWQETWMIAVMWFVTGAYSFAVVPLLLPL